MPLLLLIVALAGWCLRDYWARLGDERWNRRYGPWLAQGLAIPALAWAVANLGWSDRFPPLAPALAEAHQANAPWFRLWLAYSLGGAVVVACHWVAVSYLWLMGRIAVRARERKELAATCVIFGLFTIPAAALFVQHYGWFYLGWTIAAVLLPIVHFTADLGEERPQLVTYSRAVGQIKFGKYQEAELEVIAQLEKSEKDFDGWILLAELYARQYRNLDDAARVVFDICRDPESRPAQISIACDRLADWQLEVGANPLAARAALELMIQKIPETHFARMAAQRLKQIPRSADEFDQSKLPRKIRLPPLTEDATAPGALKAARGRADAAREANRLSQSLTDDPNDVPARHRLALVLAEDLGKVDLGIEQLGLLIALEEATEEQKAVWTAEIAKWEYHRGRDARKLCGALRALIRDYPSTSQAFAAQRQLSLLEREVRTSPAA